MYTATSWRRQERPGVAFAAPSRPIGLARHRRGPLLRLVLPVERQRGIDVLALVVDPYDVVVHPPLPPAS